MDTATSPCEVRSQRDSVTVILRPAITQASWADVETFGTQVRTELEKRNAPACLVDLSPMNYMGSAIVALIVRIWKVVQSKGGKMVVLCPHPAVLEVIQLAGLDKVWTITQEPETASRKLGVRPVQQELSRESITAGAPSRHRLLFFTLGAVTALLVLMGALVYLANR
ncbi:STAS domain-containing protein [Planctomicrobium sp. SH661]|uniref:STAS domain-containing protein n=1 Tax=Planctomicrobium sp. SH661 TaxID=3448124 RepID=UPI003F5BEC59